MKRWLEWGNATSQTGSGSESVTDGRKVRRTSVLSRSACSTMKLGGTSDKDRSWRMALAPFTFTNPTPAAIHRHQKCDRAPIPRRSTHRDAETEGARDDAGLCLDRGGPIRQRATGAQDGLKRPNDPIIGSPVSAPAVCDRAQWTCFFT